MVVVAATVMTTEVAIVMAVVAILEAVEGATMAGAMTVGLEAVASWTRIFSGI